LNKEKTDNSDLSKQAEAKVADQAREVELERNKAQRYLDIIGSILVALDSQGRITLFNKKACEMLGWTEQEALGQNWFDLCVPENVRENVRGVFDQLMTGDVAPVEYYENVLLTKSGEQRTIAFHNASTFDDTGRIIGVLFSGQDITEHKQAQEKLEASLTFTKNLISSMQDGFSVLDKNGCTMDANPAFLLMTGFSSEELIGACTPHPYWPPEEYENINAVFQKTFKDDASDFELTFMRKNGERFPVIVSPSSVKNKEGDIVSYIATVKDITERKQAEMALAESEERFSLAMKGANDGVWDWNLLTNEVVFSGRWKSMLGYSEDELENNFETWERLVHPDDIERAKKHIDDYLTCKSPKYEIEFRMLHKDGHWVDILARGFAVRDESGEKAVRLVGTHVDITERNIARDALKEKAEEIREGLIGTVLAVSRAVEARDPYTAGHQRSVSALSRSIAQEMGLDKYQIEGVRMGALIHDIGKIQMPAEILSKPGKLTEAEYKLIQAHPEAGYEILKDVKFPWPIADIARQHHERVDGSGYPQGLKGDEICIEARIVAVADVVEAMSSHRPYRPGLGIDLALEEIQSHKGTLYDEAVSNACIKIFTEKRFSF